ncbi:MAG TPA: arylesterase [Bryobacteraceae bacterium]|nr:arylesterase [Bryobacteraceae bacterium]
MRKIWFLALAVALCGCQQKETSQPAAGLAPSQPSAAAASPPADARPVIDCFGDSLTAGLGLDTGQSYPDRLQHELDTDGYRYRVANMGVSGETTQDGLSRMGMVLEQKPAIVILEFGANDGLRGQPVANAERNLDQMIEAIQKAGAHVLLAGITLPPNYGADYIRRFNGMYPELAAKYKVPLIPFLLVNVAGHANLMQRDGLHPNAEGTRVVAATVWKALEPMLKR